ncbi:prolipoprotein diacylglyceryl transferase [Williamsoniiplasma luminosum]|uniref:Prolipoprotein diacylglyceryl transferase n=1 Tax=Williamsoniiplasma luminosum TaxID=214888 RepID=A0A2K8NSG8_9MOLU|nr:prolipoprotein diacylglyceryl transferase family protein [Williamsoniiplasma luminosum]ATZ16795.1 prolipoprotein diacylglyceryl transferase [Williamsoniiplasma luminosum]
MWQDWSGRDWSIVMSNEIKPEYGGFFRVYAFTMTLGMALAILYSVYKFKRKGLPLSAIPIATIFIIPISLFGASLFGKLNEFQTGVQNFQEFLALFAFWQGGLSIHGGVYGGVLAGIIIFYFIGRKTHISLLTYFDAIVPNILLGQVAGRWGNFFNHELTGPAWFKVGTCPMYSADTIDYSQIHINSEYQSMYDGPFSWLLRNTLGVEKGTGDVYQMVPIFLIESVSLLLVWVLITFVVPNIGKWLGPKPYKKYPNKYQFSWSFTFLHFVAPWVKSETKKTYNQVWDDAYYKNVDEKAKDEFILKAQAIQASTDSKWVKRRKTVKELNSANNPERYWITKVGFEGFAFFFGWNLVRFLLEMSRSEDGLFIMYDKPLSLTVIGLSALVGLIGMIITQIGVPQFFRKDGYIYEKEYFSLQDATNVEVKKEPKTHVVNESKQEKNKAKQAKAQAKLEKLEKKK